MKSGLWAVALGVLFGAGVARADTTAAAPSPLPSPAPSLAPEALGRDADRVRLEAREHFQRGSRLVDLGRYDEAVREYELAYERRDDPALLYDLGVVHRLAGHPMTALRLFELYLRRVPDAPNRLLVQAKIFELRERGAAVPPAPSLPLAAHPVAAAVASTPPPRPFYRRPWFYALIGGVVLSAGAGAIAAVAVSRSGPWATSPEFGPGSHNGLTAAGR